MRSRYSAYALGLVDYIQKTATEASLDEDIQLFCENTSFDGLEILEVEEGEEISFVTFKATLSQAGGDASFVEKSRFVKREELWVV